MKLELKNGRVYGVSAGFQGEGDLVLVLSVEAPCTVALARELNCFDEVYHSANGTRKRPEFRAFTRHGLMGKINSGRVVFSPGKPAKDRNFECKASGFEVQNTGEVVTVRCRVSIYGRDEQVQAFAMMQSVKKEAFEAIALTSSQKELFEQAEEPEAAEQGSIEEALAD